MDPTNQTPWTATVHDRTVVITFPVPYRVLSWASLGGGLVEARTIFNHQIKTDETFVCEPEAFLQLLVERLSLSTPVVGLLTGVKMERLVRRIVQHDAVLLECFATVGLSNALAVGDPATYDEKPGTINLIVAANQPLAVSALIEAVQIVTEAKVAALYNVSVQSTVSRALATGTGTDCVAIACPIGDPAYRYCGKHTCLGELIGRVVGEAIAEGLQRTRGT